MDAIALASDPFTDRAGRGFALIEYILKEVERMTALVPPRSSEETRSRQEGMRKQLLRAIGMETLPPRTPLNPVITGQIDRGDYIIEKVALESRPKHVVPGLIYVPKNAKFPVPGIVGAMGHGRVGKSGNELSGASHRDGKARLRHAQYRPMLCMGT